MNEEERKMRLNWKKASGVAAILGALLLMTAVGFSQHPGGQQGPPPPGGGFHGGPGGRGPEGGGRGGLLEHLSREVNLTDDQKAQIKKIGDAFEESTKGLREQMHTLQESQPDPLAGGAFDEAAVRAAAQARANVQVEMEVAHARLMSQVMSVLTAEQKAQLAAKRQEFERRRPEGPPREGPND
jgi:Spy/CpxP family protein refolding chaperone